MLKINILCAIVALLTAPVVLADELSETGEFLDGVAAVVNEGIVLKSQFDKQLAIIKARASEQDMQLPPDEVLHEQVLERLIVTEIQLQRAERIGLIDQISDQYINASIQRIADQNGVRFEDLPASFACVATD